MSYIGIDIGGTKTAGGIVSEDGKILQRLSLPTPIKEGGPAILETAIEVARKLLGQTDQVQAIGIGTGGQIDAEQGVVFSATAVLPGYCGLRITDGFTNALRLPSKVDNDVNVLALAEHRFGAARSVGKGTVVFLALGTGVGGAILINGRLHHGATWTGGELGHILLSMDPDARCDLGGAKGTLEAYCSGPGLVQTYRELSGKKDIDLAGEDVVAESEKDPTGAAAKAINQTGKYLGFGLVSFANSLDPNLFVIGGGLATLGDRLLIPAREILKTHAMPGPAKCSVVTAEFGNDAAIIGAASLVMPAKVLNNVG